MKAGDTVRIRQLRPEFWTDPVTGQMAPSVMLTYIGLWGIADDAGWLVWEESQVGVLIYPYQSIQMRTRYVREAAKVLSAAGRIVPHDCGCVLIPTLSEHQRIGGRKSFVARDRHRLHRQSIRVHTGMDGYAGNVTLGNVTERNGQDETNDHDQEEDGDLIEAFRRLGLPVQ